MFFSTLRDAVRRRREAEADRDFWKEKALDLEQKLMDRTDFFVEREFRIIDRFFTSEKKTYAITDEIRQKDKQVTDEDVHRHDLEAFLQEKRDWLLQCAKDAGLEDPEDVASRDFERNRSLYVLQFEQAM